MQDVFASNFRLHVVAVEAVRVLVDVRAIRWMKTEAIGVRPRGATQLSKVDGRLCRERCVGQVVSRAERAALAVRIRVDCSRSLGTLGEIVQ